MRRFELVEGKSSKFWEVECSDAEVTVRFGRIGTNGQTQTKSFSSADSATKEMEKLIREKTKKGYAEKTQPAASPSTESIEAPAPQEEAQASPEKPTKKTKAPKKAEPQEAHPGWLDAGNGYWLTLRDGKLVCRKGTQELASVPKAVKEGDVAERLTMVREWLDRHDRECLQAVENWMLRSLPVPRKVLESVWEDPSWRKALENAFVVPCAQEGVVDLAAGGFLKGVGDRGLGLVDAEGETQWVKADSVAIPHPVVLEDLDGLRELANELSLQQGIAQLYREVYRRGRDQEDKALSVRAYAEGHFQALNHCLGQCRKLGYRVKGGSAIVRVWEKGSVFEARYWVGAEDPTVESWTGDLTWVDDQEKALALGGIPPVAFSEGMRMAAGIYAARKVEKEASDG